MTANERPISAGDVTGEMEMEAVGQKLFEDMSTQTLMLFMGDLAHAVYELDEARFEAAWGNNVAIHDLPRSFEYGIPRDVLMAELERMYAHLDAHRDEVEEEARDAESNSKH